MNSWVSFAIGVDVGVVARRSWCCYLLVPVGAVVSVAIRMSWCCCCLKELVLLLVGAGDVTGVGGSEFFFEI